MSSHFGSVLENKNNLLSISKQIFMVQQELKDLKVAKRRKTQQLSELLIDYNYFNLRFAHVSNLQHLEDKESTQSSPQRSKTTLFEDTEVSIISHNEVTSDDDVLDMSVDAKPLLRFTRKKVFQTSDKRIVDSDQVIEKCVFGLANKKESDHEKVYLNDKHVGWTLRLKDI